MKSAEKLNETLTSIDCSPLKKVQKDREVGYGKRKFKEAKDQLASSFSDVIPGLDNLTICNDCDVLMRQVKEKLDKCHTREERIQFLTLIPENWSTERAVTFFNVTEYMVRAARNDTKEKGILGIPDSIHTNGLSDELLVRVKSFYEEDQISQMCAGKKDFVNIKSSHGTKKHHQKRLIFCNIREVYLQYKSTFLDDKLGFSKFAELRPKWYRTVGQSGSHNVCICTYHQNVKLMLLSIQH